MLELAVLGLLKEKPMHGYDLRKQLRAHFGPLANLSFGSLYPALARLEAGGAVRTISATDTPRSQDLVREALPLTGSLGGERASLVARRATAESKPRRLGGARPQGTQDLQKSPNVRNELFDELLDAPESHGDDASSFSLRLAFARHPNPAQARIRLLERRRVQLTDRLQKGGSPAHRRSGARHLRARHRRTLARSRRERRRVD